MKMNRKLSKGPGRLKLTRRQRALALFSQAREQALSWRHSLSQCDYASAIAQESGYARAAAAEARKYWAIFMGKEVAS